MAEVTLSMAKDTSVDSPNSKKELLRYWLVFLACLGLICFRGWDRLIHAELFAEDTMFVEEAFSHGWLSLFILYDFFAHTVPRIIAVFAVKIVPIEHLPFFTNFVCYVLTAAAMANVSRTCYRWLIPSDAARIGFCLIVVCAPGLYEFLGNITGIHWALLFWLATLSLKDLEESFTVWELILLALIVVTVGAAIVFVGIAFVRLIFAWNSARTSNRRYLSDTQVQREAIFFGMLLLVSTFLVLNFILQDAPVGGGDSGIDIVKGMRSLEDLLIALGNLFVGFFVLHPFLGTHHTSVFLRVTPFYPLLVVCILLMGMLFWRLKGELDQKLWLILAWLVCIFLIAVMLSFVRYWTFYGVFRAPYWDWWFRYNFIFAVAGLLLWFILMRPKKLVSFSNWTSVVILVLIVSYVSQANTMIKGAVSSHSTDRFAIDRYGEAIWPEAAKEIRRSMETGCPKKVIFKAYPRRQWVLEYHTTVTGQDCSKKI